jgi:hypothetical protein
MIRLEVSSICDGWTADVALGESRQSLGKWVLSLGAEKRSGKMRRGSKGRMFD